MSSSASLERKTRNYALKLKRQRRYPAAVSGAEFSRLKSVDHSKPVDPTLLVKKLRAKLLSLGNLYTKVNGNIIGCCAEVNSANQLLLKRVSIGLGEIRFAKTIRPRTMQVIRECTNCKHTF